MQSKKNFVFLKLFQKFFELFILKIKFSFNLTAIVVKEFEIFVTEQQQKQQELQNEDFNSYFYIGHKENDINLDLLFHFDIGQIILSESIRIQTTFSLFFSFTFPNLSN